MSTFPALSMPTPQPLTTPVPPHERPHFATRVAKSSTSTNTFNRSDVVVRVTLPQTSVPWKNEPITATVVPDGSDPTSIHDRGAASGRKPGGVAIRSELVQKEAIIVRGFDGHVAFRNGPFFEIIDIEDVSIGIACDASIQINVAVRRR